MTVFTNASISVHQVEQGRSRSLTPFTKADATRDGRREYGIYGSSIVTLDHVPVPRPPRSSSLAKPLPPVPPSHLASNLDLISWPSPASHFPPKPSPEPLRFLWGRSPRRSSNRTPPLDSTHPTPSPPLPSSPLFRKLVSGRYPSIKSASSHSRSHSRSHPHLTISWPLPLSAGFAQVEDAAVANGRKGKRGDGQSGEGGWRPRPKRLSRAARV